MSDMTWGLPETRPVKPARPARAGVAPRVAAAAHGGIVRLHLAALALWLGIAAVLGAVAAAGGRDIPAVVFVACLAAGAGHGLFLALHLAFGAAARRRLAQPQAQPPRAPGA